jgi:hypothetical protein
LSTTFVEGDEVVFKMEAHAFPTIYFIVGTRDHPVYGEEFLLVSVEGEPSVAIEEEIRYVRPDEYSTPETEAQCE